MEGGIRNEGEARKITVQMISEELEVRNQLSQVASQNNCRPRFLFDRRILSLIRQMVQEVTSNFDTKAAIFNPDKLNVLVGKLVSHGFTQVQAQAIVKQIKPEFKDRALFQLPIIVAICLSVNVAILLCDLVTDEHCLNYAFFVALMIAPLFIGIKTQELLIKSEIGTYTRELVGIDQTKQN